MPAPHVQRESGVLGDAPRASCTMFESRAGRPDGILQVGRIPCRMAQWHHALWLNHVQEGQRPSCMMVGLRAGRSKGNECCGRIACRKPRGQPARWSNRVKDGPRPCRTAVESRAARPEAMLRAERVTCGKAAAPSRPRSSRSRGERGTSCGATGSRPARGRDYSIGVDSSMGSLPGRSGAASGSSWPVPGSTSGGLRRRRRVVRMASFWRRMGSSRAATAGR